MLQVLPLLAPRCSTEADYDAQVRDAVLEFVLEDGLNLERTTSEKTAQRDFGLKLSQGFVYNCFAACAWSTRPG